MTFSDSAKTSPRSARRVRFLYIFQEKMGDMIRLSYILKIVRAALFFMHALVFSFQIEFATAFMKESYYSR